MTVRIDPSWHAALKPQFESPYFEELSAFVKGEYSANDCFPPAKNIFRAFDLTPFDKVKVVILGQDPYHTPGAAMGLSFSVPDGSKAQPSLQNIFKELKSDLGIERTKTDLTDWAEQGVLLLNSVLTVQSGLPASHRNKGWEIFTDAAIKALSDGREHLVFILWGNFAIGKLPLIDAHKHVVIRSPHPSPFSAHSGFFGSKPFSKANTALTAWSDSEIRW